MVCYLEGHHGDNSGMVLLGDVHPDIVNLSKVTREAMYIAIEMYTIGAYQSANQPNSCQTAPEMNSQPPHALMQPCGIQKKMHVYIHKKGAYIHIEQNK